MKIKMTYHMTNTKAYKAYPRMWWSQNISWNNLDSNVFGINGKCSSLYNIKTKMTQKCSHTRHPYTFDSNAFARKKWVLSLTQTRYRAGIGRDGIFVKLEEIHIAKAHKPLIHQNQPVACYQHRNQAKNGIPADMSNAFGHLSRCTRNFVCFIYLCFATTSTAENSTIQGRLKPSHNRLLRVNVSSHRHMS